MPVSAPWRADRLLSAMMCRASGYRVIQEWDITSDGDLDGLTLPAPYPPERSTTTVLFGVADAIESSGRQCRLQLPAPLDRGQSHRFALAIDVDVAPRRHVVRPPVACRAVHLFTRFGLQPPPESWRISGSARLTRIDRDLAGAAGEIGLFFHDVPRAARCGITWRPRGSTTTDAVQEPLQHSGRLLGLPG